MSTTPEQLAALPIRSRTGPAQWVSYGVGIYVALVLVQLFVFNDNWRWQIVGSYLFNPRVLEGVLHTIELTIVTTILGLFLGILTACCRLSSLKVLRILAVVYIWVMRAMPPLVLILLIYFLAALVPTLSIGLPFGPSLVDISTNDAITRFSAAVIGLSVYLGAYTGETFRGGVMSLPAGQFEACRTLGIPPLRAYQKILGPQLVRVIMPPLANEVITTFKNTSLVTVIGYSELLTTVQTIYAKNFQTIPLLTVAVIWYLALTSIAMFGQHRLERRFGRGFTPRKSEGSGK